MMLLRARDNNNQSFEWFDGGLEPFNFRMLKELVLISFMKPGVRKTLNIKIVVKSF